MKQEPIFYDIDPKTGHATPTSLDSVRKVLREEAGLPLDAPKEVNDNLLAAIDRLGLAYERANAGDWALFNLHRDALLCVARALERALKDRLGRERGTLGQITKPAIDQGLLQESDFEWVEMLRQLRNETAHESEPQGGPPVAASLLRKTARTVSSMYETRNSIG